MKNEYNETIVLSDIIERYCHDSLGCNNEDKYLACCFYEKDTETIRLYPQNNCLVDFLQKETKYYLQTNSVTIKYLSILKEQAAQHEKELNWSCHIGKGKDFLRERFAWLIGESIKKLNNQIPFYLTDTLIV